MQSLKSHLLPLKLGLVMCSHPQITTCQRTLETVDLAARLIRQTVGYQLTRQTHERQVCHIRRELVYHHTCIQEMCVFHTLACTHLAL